MMPKGNKRGFTIVELLTVMSIIIILISVLVPALNRVRKVAKDVSQKAQFYDIDRALTEYRNDHQDEYPDSNRYDSTGTVSYCGAMRLCEALVGQDGMGFNPESKFLSIAGNGADGNALYQFDLCTRLDPSSSGFTTAKKDNLKKRIRYLENTDIKAAPLGAMFTRSSISPFAAYATNQPMRVLCDVYNRVPVNTAVCADLGDKTGMPILYYRADVRKFSHDVNHPSNPDNIYNHLDNDELVGLGLPWEATLTTIPPLSSDPSTWFYKRITNTAVTSTLVPFKKSEYILISAGFDGIFGTNDDVYNFRR